MELSELIVIAVGLSMDAFAVAVCKGVCLRKAGVASCSTVGAYFGIFQAGMPVIGYFLGARFAQRIAQFDHWIAFVLLAVIGAKMLVESFKKDETECSVAASDRQELRFTRMVVLAVATSIDALAVGVTFAFLNVNIAFAAGLIGVVTFAFSAAGVRIGHIFGERFKSGAELAGGVILIGMGVKILLEHLGVLDKIFS